MQYVSGEDHRSRRQGPKRPQWSLGRVIGLAIVVFAILAGGIYGAVVYEKHQNQQNNNPTSPSPASNASSGTGVSNSNGASGGSSDGKRSTGGGSFKATVTAVSAQSITVKLADGTTKTYAITTGTTISNARTQSFGSAGSGQSSTNDIHTGDAVLVTPDPNNASQAIGILVNPA